MFEIDLNPEKCNNDIFELDALFAIDALLYDALKRKLQRSEISEESLMEWARFVKLASSEDVSINQLKEFAVIKILRSWKSIEGMLLLTSVRDKT